jgi:trk system potassium uptake protein TrkH
VLIRPQIEDFRVVGLFMGRIFLVVAGSGLLPLAWSAVAGEWRSFGSFLLMMGIFGVLGVLGLRLGPKRPRLDWSHGMVVVALTWLVVPVIAAVPLALSGHFGDPLDALFDAVSGLTTTGLSVMSDLDHLASSLNLWRHLLQFLGGLGIVVAALMVFAGTGGITLYVGEGRGERFLPSVTSTVRFMGAVAALHLVVVVASLTLIGWLVLGFEPGRSAFHAITMFFAGFSTGGFAPHSTSIGYYHSLIFEIVAMTSMVGGAMSFGLHYALWRGPRRDALANLETRTMLASIGFTLFLVLVGLATTGAFAAVGGLTRQGFFQLYSAHTTTGWATIPSSELSEWGGFAFVGMALAMALGGMGSSTAGGVKALRVGLTVKAVLREIRQVLLPEGAVISTRYHQGGTQRLTHDVIQSVMTISLLYVALYLLGAAVGLAYGIPLRLSLFESVSASATIGLSVGVTDPSMPVPLQVVYMLQMWAGRLEFVSLFSLLGFLYAWVKGE